MSEQCSPMAALVMCMVVLSVFGTLIGGLHWYTVDRPAQEQLLSAPQNSVLTPWVECTDSASETRTSCRQTCEFTYPDDVPKNIKLYKACMQQCDVVYRTNYNACSALYCPGTCPTI